MDYLDPEDFKGQILLSDRNSRFRHKTTIIDVESELMDIVKKGGPCEKLLLNGELRQKIEMPEQEDYTIFWLLELELTPEITVTPDMWKRFNRKELRQYLTKNYRDTVKNTSSRGYTVQSLKQTVKELGYTLQIRLDEAKFREATEKFRAEQETIRDKFKEALFAEFGVVGKNKTDEFFEKAWKLGGGPDRYLAGVYKCFAELESLIC